MRRAAEKFTCLQISAIRFSPGSQLRVYGKNVCKRKHSQNNEFFGCIVQIGKSVSGYESGDRIIAEQIVPSWECRFRKTGKYGDLKTAFRFRKRFIDCFIGGDQQ